MPSLEAENAAKVAELIKDIRVAMFVTAGTDGEVHARPMYTQQEEDDGGVLWFLADSTSRKVADIASEQNVLLVYADPSVSKYVTVRGKALAVHDPERAKRMWSIHARAWFPDGPEDPHLTLIRVQPEFAEYWDGPSRVVYALSIVKSAVTGARPAVGHHAEVNMD